MAKYPKSTPRIGSGTDDEPAGRGRRTRTGDYRSGTHPARGVRSGTSAKTKSTKRNKRRGQAQATTTEPTFRRRRALKKKARRRLESYSSSRTGIYSPFIAPKRGKIRALANILREQEYMHGTRNPSTGELSYNILHSLGVQIVGGVGLPGINACRGGNLQADSDVSACRGGNLVPAMASDRFDVEFSSLFEEIPGLDLRFTSGIGAGVDDEPEIGAGSDDSACRGGNLTPEDKFSNETDPFYDLDDARTINFDQKSNQLIFGAPGSIALAAAYSFNIQRGSKYVIDRIAVDRSKF